MPSRRSDFRRKVVPCLLVVFSALSCARIFGFREGELLPADGDDSGLSAGSGGTPDTGGGGLSGGGNTGGAGVANTAGEGGSSAGRGGSSAAGRGGSSTGGYAGDAGGCRPEECKNPDPDHCEVLCTDGACSVIPLDRDGDDHGDVSCAAAPGDDCDDSVDSIHPGVAMETCDGRDNDCDGWLDLEDGLEISGKLNDLGYGWLNGIAYSPSAQKFAALWLEEKSLGNFGIHYRLIALDGTMGETHAFDGAPPSTISVALAGNDGSLEPGEGAFALVWSTLSQATLFQQLTPDGEPIAPIIPLTTELDTDVAVAHVNGHWAAFWFEQHTYGGVFGRTIDANGTLGMIADFQASIPFGLTGDMVAVSHQPPPDADRLLLVYSTESVDRGFILSPSLLGGAIVPSTTGFESTVAARVDGFAVASLIRRTPNFRSLRLNGEARCDLELPWTPTSVAPSANGYVVVGNDGVDGKLLEVSVDCEPLQFRDAPGANLIVSAGEHGYLMVGPNFQTGPLVWRRTGPHFCD